MTDTVASSPLSEPPEPNTPIEVEPRAADPARSPESLAPSHIADPAPPVASTSAHAVAPASKAKRGPAKPRRKGAGATSGGHKKDASRSTLVAAAAALAVESEPCPACRQLDAIAHAGARQAETVWVECDKCEAWFHWSCVSTNPKDSPESLDKWYCDPCLTASLATPAPLTISYKLASSAPPVASTSNAPAGGVGGVPHVRKSGRSTKSQIDYSNLHEHLPASADRWTHVIAARTQAGQIKPDRFERKRPGDLSLEWVYGSRGMLEPFVVETPDGLGMSMPRRDISVREIAELIGPETPLEVIDCASQSSLANWTLGQWAEYYSSSDRDKVRNVISLEVSDTRLGKMVVAPELVRNLDWVDTIWPEDMKAPGQFPRVQKYCLMSVEKCWTDWHVDFAGSSVFYHVLKGGKTFYFIRPTPANLAAYEKWSGSTEKQEQEWLGDSCDEVLKIELQEGNTAFLPTGWIHAVYTPADSIVIGGNFLHSLNIPTQLRIYEIELATKVPKKFRYPHFVKLLWLVAIHYQYHLSRMQLPPSATSPLPPTLSPRVLEGLLALSAFLINQTTRFLKSPHVSAERRRIARENVPWNKVADPVGLTREFRKSVLRAMARELDADCFKPHGTEEDDPAAAVASAGGVGTTTNGNKKGAGGGVKRKGTEEPAASATKSAKIKHATTTAGSPPPPGGLNNQGEIISRQVVPAPPSTRFEPRLDPKRPDLGVRPAEVRETRNSQIVVRRWEDQGETFVETRSVHTVIERVKWSNVKAEPDSNGATPSHPSYRPYVVAPPALAASTPPPFATSPAPPVFPYPYPPLPSAAAPTLPQATPFSYGPFFSQPPQFAPHVAAAPPRQHSNPSPPTYPPLPQQQPPHPPLMRVGTEPQPSTTTTTTTTKTPSSSTITSILNSS